MMPQLLPSALGSKLVISRTIPTHALAPKEGIHTAEGNLRLLHLDMASASNIVVVVDAVHDLVLRIQDERGCRAEDSRLSAQRRRALASVAGEDRVELMRLHIHVALASVWWQRKGPEVPLAQRGHTSPTCSGPLVLE